MSLLFFIKGKEAERKVYSEFDLAPFDAKVVHVTVELLELCNLKGIQEWKNFIGCAITANHATVWILNAPFLDFCRNLILILILDALIMQLGLTSFYVLRNLLL